MKKRTDENRDSVINKSIFIMPLAVTVVALVLVIVFLILEANKIDNFAVFALKNFSVTLLSIGACSLLLEFVGNVEYTKKKLIDVITTDEFIEVLSDKRKRELRSKLIRSIHAVKNPDILLDDNNITTIMDKDVSDILDDYYYEELRYTIIVAKEKDHIEKKIHIGFKARTLSGEKILAPIINVSFDKEADKNFKPIEIIKMRINEKEIKGSDIMQSFKSNEESEKTLLEYRYSLKDYISENESLFTFDNTIEGELLLITRVPLCDNVYSVRVPKACKKFEMHISSKHYNFEPHCFGFKSVAGDLRETINNMKNMLNLWFEDWILPGEGVVINLRDE